MKRRPHSAKHGSAPVSAEAKVFMTGRSQAVRLPKEFRVQGDSVYIKRVGENIVLTPKTLNRWATFFAALDQFPRDFTLDRNQRQAPRSSLGELFQDDES